MSDQNAKYQLNRGDICVSRMFQGTEAWLRLHNQASFKEWTGCFSVLK